MDRHPPLDHQNWMPHEIIDTTWLFYIHLAINIALLIYFLRNIKMLSAPIETVCFILISFGINWVMFYQDYFTYFMLLFGTLGTVLIFAIIYTNIRFKRIESH